MDYKDYSDESRLGGEIFQWFTKGKQNTIEGQAEAIKGALEIAKQKEIARIEAEKAKTERIKLIGLIFIIVIISIFLLFGFKMYLNRKKNEK